MTVYHNLVHPLKKLIFHSIHLLFNLLTPQVCDIIAATVALRSQDNSNKIILLG